MGKNGAFPENSAIPEFGAGCATGITTAKGDALRFGGSWSAIASVQLSYFLRLPGRDLALAGVLVCSPE